MPPSFLSLATDGLGENRAGAIDPSIARAIVMVGDIETTYRLFGQGATTIVLLGLNPTMRRGVSFSDTLPDDARVIIADHTTIAALAPSTRSEESPFGRWLRGFLEGIGVREARVVAHGALATEMEQFDALNPGSLRRRVLIGGVRHAAPEHAVYLALDATWAEIWHAALASPNAAG